MADQFDVYRTVSGSVVVVIQNDLLADLQTRVVAFLAQDRMDSELFQYLTPQITVEGINYTLEMHSLATVSLKELGTKLGDMRDQRDKLIRAIDALLSGI